jgi:hypothetical protein
MAPKRTYDGRLKESIEETSKTHDLEEHVKRQKEIRDRHRQWRKAAKDKKHSEDSQELSKHSKELLDWAVKELKHSAAGYEHFGSVMNSMTPGTLLLADMVYAANPIGWTFDQLNHPGNIVNYFTGIEFRSVTEFVGDGVKAATDAAGRSISSRPKASIPELQYFVDLNPDGSLPINSVGKNLRRSDGLAITQQQEKYFKAAVSAWILTADHKKYQLKKRPNGSCDVIDSVTGNKLDKDAFIALRDDPRNGMKAFMERRFDLFFESLEEKPEAEPSASMPGMK